MKNSMMSLLALPILLLLSTCQKFEPDRVEIMPDKAELGKPLVYINGELLNFKTAINYYPDFNHVHALFSNYENGINDDLQFNLNSPGIGSHPSWLGLDRLWQGFSLARYTQIDYHQDLLEITLFDTINLEIAGRFEGHYRIDGPYQQSANRRRPRELIIQGVFHEKYEIF